MATETRIKRVVSDLEPDGLASVEVLWSDSDEGPPYLILAQDEDVIHLHPEHATAVVEAMLAALLERAAA